VVLALTSVVSLAAVVVPALTLLVAGVLAIALPSVLLAVPVASAAVVVGRLRRLGLGLLFHPAWEHLQEDRVPSQRELHGNGLLQLLGRAQRHKVTILVKVADAHPALHVEELWKRVQQGSVQVPTLRLGMRPQPDLATLRVPYPAQGKRKKMCVWFECVHVCAVCKKKECGKEAARC
jgi:hypothetical protein